MCAIEFVKDKKSKARFEEKEGFCERVMAYALQDGLILRQVEDIIEFALHSSSPRPEVDEMIKITRAAVTRTEKELGLL